ncbi:MAG: hypothetical protein B6245_17600 [Desulfobacteraceae bacterium 4572_88]|nr:MAG: hypothetical protein B6245_17600 [Desulfobacteraceae bacterium 4572_88]
MAQIFQKNNLTASPVGDILHNSLLPCFPSTSSGNSCEINFLKLKRIRLDSFQIPQELRKTCPHDAIAYMPDHDNHHQL